MAASVLEEAGTPYCYSTRGDEQELSLLHGRRLSGDMRLEEMVALCRSLQIKLIVDASHPFAVNLHRNVVALAESTGLPLVRYERIYPPRSVDVVWCSNYADAVEQLKRCGVRKLLALTGVNTLAPLRSYWNVHDCWFRILDRDSSREKAHRCGFPENRLVYYENEQTDALIRRIAPDAVLTKESGASGGFQEKLEAAQRYGCRLFAIERPLYAEGLHDIHFVDGPCGLRRMVESLLPDFFSLRSGLTTGTCATAAAVAAATRLTRQEMPSEVPVRLPDGETIQVEVSYGNGWASVTKDHSDDPDVTRGLEIRARVDYLDTDVSDSSTTTSSQIEIDGGEGVGRFTLPGFDYPPGSAAINKGPRQMIEDNLRPLGRSFKVVISVPEGREVSARTFNPRLGIEGGISIIGVSGIVKPFSEEAFICSIRKTMVVAQASGSDRVVIHSGAKSEAFLRAVYPDLPQQAFVEYGNYIGATLQMASELGLQRVTLGVMLGKAVKLAAGQLDTHSHRGTMDKEFIASLLDEADCPMDVSELTLARDLWNLIPENRLQTFVQVVLSYCRRHCDPLLPEGNLTILLIDEQGRIYPQP